MEFFRKWVLLLFLNILYKKKKLIKIGLLIKKRDFAIPNSVFAIPDSVL